VANIPPFPVNLRQDGSVARNRPGESAFAWLKISDPEAELPIVAPGANVRALLPEDERFTVLADKMAGSGAQVRRVRYLVEDEAVGSDSGQLTAISRACHLNRPGRRTYLEVAGAAARGARDAFDVMWEAHAAEVGQEWEPAPAADIVPAELARFLPFSTLNPAQVQVLPEVLEHQENLLVVAPTGAGKTVIGMVAALCAVVRDGRKAAWLVPQRSLTDELDSELAGWRRQGLRVERLSGEQAVDIERIRDADLWVATTEKFEAICRASAFRQALADVGVLVVDEVHLLGDAGRGPVLEALLARIRDGETSTRIVGLSATVSNSAQIARWLQARLLRSSWRPSRLTWQLPTIASHSDFAVTDAARTRLAAAITSMVADDGGSVLVFCGSKRNVRRTALVIAASRGVDTSRVRTDDLERLQQVCHQARIGLHYQGWEHRRAAEEEFRRRELDVLVATTTVAAGVNLPARAVVVQDALAGLEPLDVGTVQQMFGRAGRVGAGEREGWAFMIVDEAERSRWQSELVAGHGVRSRIRDSLAEHVLSEAVQQRIGTQQDAEQWWVQTLAYHQGMRSLRPLRKSVGFLRSADMLTGAEAGGTRLVPTELGRLTARLMVSPEVCDQLRAALGAAPVPANPDQAERTLAEILAAVVPKLAQARVGEENKAALAKLLDSCDRAGSAFPARFSTAARPDSGRIRGELARAAILAVAGSPELFHPGVRRIGGIPYPAMYPILEETPRYLHWIACQGLFGTIHPWCAIVAADLEMRIAWRMLRPPRGAGRLLWACEQMATPTHAAQVVPRLWAAARARGYTSPDWSVAGRPAGCQLDAAAYRALLRDRVTDATIEAEDGVIRAAGPAGSVLAVWNGPAYQITPIKRGYAAIETPAPAADGAIFTWRGDYRASGWLQAYTQTSERPAGPRTADANVPPPVAPHPR
jgi:helicase